MPSAIAIVIAALIIAGSFAFMFRWEIEPDTRNATVFRLDRWTGQVERCHLGIRDASEAYQYEEPVRLRCLSQ